MAELMDDGGGHGKKKGKGSKQKKKSTRIDMTAMVDVAFLLLTFFVLTTTMAKPAMLVLTMPPDRPPDESEVKVKGSKVLTLIPGKNDKVHYYFGAQEEGQPPEIKTTGFDPEKGLRVLIRNHMKKGEKMGLPLCKDKETKNCWDPIVVIKPAKTCKYGNLVDVLDEMKVGEVPKYALTKLSPEDSILLVQYQKE